MGQRSSPCCSGGVCHAPHTEPPPRIGRPLDLHHHPQPGRSCAVAQGPDCEGNCSTLGRSSAPPLPPLTPVSSPASHRRLPHAPLIPASRQTDMFVQPLHHVTPGLAPLRSASSGAKKDWTDASERSIPRSSHAGTCRRSHRLRCGIVYRLTPMHDPCSGFPPNRLLVFAVDRQAADRELSHAPPPVRQPGGSLHHTTAETRGVRRAALTSGSTASHFIGALNKAAGQIISRRCSTESPPHTATTFD